MGMPLKQRKQIIISDKHNIVKNPSSQRADQTELYLRSHDALDQT